MLDQAIDILRGNMSWRGLGRSMTLETRKKQVLTISVRPSLTLRPCGMGVPQAPTLPSSPTASHQRATRQLPDRYSITRHSISSATVTISNFTPHSCKNFWYNIGDLIREEGITLMRGDVLVFVA